MWSFNLHIAKNLLIFGLSRYALKRKLKFLGWGGVYHNLYPEDLDAMIPQSVPFTRVGCYWGIHFTQATLC